MIAIDPSQHLTIAGAAARLKRPYSTIRRAIQRGELRPVETADGAELLAIADVDAWDSEDRKPGPRPRKGEAA